MRAKTSDFLKVLNRARPDAEKKEMKTIMGKTFHPLTLGIRKRKRLTTEGWNTCYWIIVAFNIALLQVLKGFSILDPFRTRLENNLQKQAVLARTS